MAIEQITPEQKEAAEKALKECQSSVQQDSSQTAQQIEKEAKEKIDQISQKLARIPENIIKDIQKSIETILKIVSGYNFPGSPSFDADQVIASIESAVQPVVDGLGALPVPAVPGLSDVKPLLENLKNVKPSPEEKKEIDKNFKDKLPAIPPEFYAILNSLLAAIQAIAYTLPLVLINLIFQMIDTIVGLFKQIANVIGVPGIPFPLSVVSQCIELMPKIIDLVPKLGNQVETVAENKARQTVAMTTVKQFPEPPKDIPQPQLHEPCPQRQEQQQTSQNQEQSQQ